MSSDEERMEEGVEGSSSGEEGVGGRGVSHLGGWETEAMLTGLGTGTSAWCLPLGRRSDKSRDCLGRGDPGLRAWLPSILPFRGISCTLYVEYGLES